MLIFDKCRRSSAAVTPVKYECDANNLRGTFARSKILLTEKLTNGALVTPTPAHLPVANISYARKRSLEILLSECETMLQCDVVSHSLSAFTKGSPNTLWMPIHMTLSHRIWCQRAISEITGAFYNTQKEMSFWQHFVTSKTVILSHTPHCFGGVGIMFMNRPWAIQVW